MMDLVRREIARALSALRMPLRAVQRTIDTAPNVQRVGAEGIASESLQGMELFQQFGFTSGVPDGTQLIVLPLGGRTSAAVVIATENGTYRFKVDKGEAAIYNQWGDVIHLKSDRTIHMKSDLKVVVESPLAQFTGDIEAANIHSSGNVVADGNVADQGGEKTMAGMRSAFNTHTQVVTGGVAQAPGGGM
jgi:phage baseplate assembly protein V